MKREQVIFEILDLNEQAEKNLKEKQEDVLTLHPTIIKKLINELENGRKSDYSDSELIQFLETLQDN